MLPPVPLPKVIFFPFFLKALRQYSGIYFSCQIDDAQEQKMANLMEGRSFGVCENQCYDLLQDCLDVAGGGDAGCWASFGVCMAKC